MEIRIAENSEDIAKLMDLDDEIEESIKGDRGEWIQWLMSCIANPKSKVTIWIAEGENGVEGYLVLLDGRIPPLTDCMFIVYAYSKLPHEDNKELFETIKDWAIEQGVHTFLANAKRSSLLERYGFEKSEQINMKMEF